MIPLIKNTFLNETKTKTALSKFIRNATVLSMNIECQKFEKLFAEYHKKKDAILFNSGGSANLAILQSLKNIGKLKTDDKIGFSALTWSTNVMPIIQLGFRPIPVDCQISTLNVMSDNLAHAINQYNLKAMFITNVLGFTGDLNKIKSICKKKDVLLIEDNCESLGTELSNHKAGTFGFAGSFSFYVAHHLSTIEGGMVITDDIEFAQMLRIVRANGWDRNLSIQQQKKLRKKNNIIDRLNANYTFYDLAYNLRPTEITGFLGQYQMQYLDENIDKRIENYLAIEKVIAHNNDLIFLDRDHLTRLSSFAIPVICKTKILRKNYIKKFSDAGIEIRPMIAGNMQKQPFFKKYVDEMISLPNTDFIHECGFYCGNYPELSPKELKLIAVCLSKL